MVRIHLGSPFSFTFGLMRPHRLAWPRTPPFHGGDRGSNPLGDAIFLSSNPRRIHHRTEHSHTPLASNLPLPRTLHTNAVCCFPTYVQSHSLCTVPCCFTLCSGQHGDTRSPLEWPNRDASNMQDRMANRCLTEILLTVTMRWETVCDGGSIWIAKKKGWNSS